MLLPKIYPVTCHTDHVGPGSTFVAIQGFKRDGTQYIATALERGATTVVVQTDAVTPAIEQLCATHNATLQTVTDTRQALATLVNAALGHPWRHLTLVGITGTKGKTTTAFLVEHLLRTAGHPTALLSTICNRIGADAEDSTNTTPGSDTLAMFLAECVKRGVTHVVMEVSSHALSLHRVHGVGFDAVGFTNLAPEHMDYHLTMDDYFATKATLFDHLKPGGTIVINGDGPWGERAATAAEAVRTHSTRPTGSLRANGENSVEVKKLEELQLITVTPSEQHVQETEQAKQLVQVIVYGQNPVRPERSANARSRMGTNGLKAPIPIPITIISNTLAGISCTVGTDTLASQALFGAHNAYNMAMAALITRALNVPAATVSTAIANFPGVPGRLQRHTLSNGAVAFVDFAHNPSSMQAVLETLRHYTQHLIVVFGCGGDKDKTKRPVMGAIAATLGDVVIVTDDNPRTEDRHTIINEILCGISPELMHKVTTQPDRHAAIEQAAALAHAGSIIALLGKGHETYYLVGTKKHYFNDFEEVTRF